MAEKVIKVLSKSYSMYPSEAGKHTANFFDYIESVSRDNKVSLSDNQKAKIIIDGIKAMQHSVIRGYPINAEPAYVSPLEKIAEFCRKNPDTFYSPFFFGTELNLDANPRGISCSLAKTHMKFGLTKIIDAKDQQNSSYYGYSQTCGPRECFTEWCAGKILKSCPTGEYNSKMKFVKRDGT